MRYAFVEVLNIHNTMNLNNIQIRETATSDFSHIMEVEKLRSEEHTSELQSQR